MSTVKKSQIIKLVRQYITVKNPYQNILVMVRPNL